MENKITFVDDFDEVEEIELYADSVQFTDMDYRKYLKAVRYLKLQKENLEKLKKEVLEETKNKYDKQIEKFSGPLDRLTEYLKHQLLADRSKFQKSGGYKVNIPDVGVFSCSKEKIGFEPTEEQLEDKKYFETKESFSKKKFNEFCKKYAVTDDGLVINEETGEIVEGMKIVKSRNWKVL